LPNSEIIKLKSIAELEESSIVAETDSKDKEGRFKYFEYKQVHRKTAMSSATPISHENEMQVSDVPS
jgi:hypothetical protein